MPKDSTQTVKDILIAAKYEFLEKGYINASMRKIAERANVTTGALYRHYKDKSALFDALLEPVCTDIYRILDSYTDLFFSNTSPENFTALIDNECQNPQNEIFVLTEYFYSHFDEMKILLSSSEHSSYEQFVHQFINYSLEHTLDYIHQCQIQIPDKDKAKIEKSFHLLISAQLSAIFELILHDIPREEGLELMTIASRFFYGGWKEVFQMLQDYD